LQILGHFAQQQSTQHPEKHLCEWGNILPRGTLDTTSHDTCKATTINNMNNLVSANITKNSPESRGEEWMICTRGRWCVCRVENKKRKWKRERSHVGPPAEPRLNFRGEGFSLI